MQSFLQTTVNRIGNAASWLVPVVVLLTFAIVVMRYSMNMGWIWLQELTVYFHAAAFLLGVAWTLAQDGHVRVDIFYREAGVTKKAWVNLVGTLIFLLPLCVFIIWTSLDYVLASWQTLEGSRESGGLPGVFILKTLIPVFGLLLLMQSVVNLRRYYQVLAGGHPDRAKQGSA